ncbi:MAG: CHASE domain-containing protein [Candidatus Omnitrophica bacterium]|nr:CHASE domain-containing protein [Candidatus Omnitrophota bacterium]
MNYPVPQDKTLAYLRYFQLTLVVLLSIGLVVGAFFWVQNSQTEKLHLEFERLSAACVQSLQQGVDESLTALLSASNFSAATSSVDSREFGKFVFGIKLDQPEIRAMGWAPQVKESVRSAFETSARQNLGGFMIKEKDSNGSYRAAQTREVYYPVYFLEPDLREASELIGFDIGSNADCALAMQAAQSKGLPAAVEQRALGIKNAGAFSLLVFLPVRRGVGSAAELSEEDNLRGYVIGLVEMDDLVTELLGQTNLRGVQVLLSGMEDTTGESLLFELGRGKLAIPPGKGLIPAGTQEFEVRNVLKVGGRKWYLTCSPTAEFLNQRRSVQPWIALWGGLMLSGLLGAYLFMGMRRASQIEKLVSERMAELAMANQGLVNEMTVRKRAEKSLKRANEELRDNQKELLDALHERERAEERLRSVNEELVENEKKLLQTMADLGQTNEELQNTQLQLMDAEKLELVGRLAAGLAHEVKHPLSVLLMGAEYIRRERTSTDPDNEGIETMLEDMIVAVKRADSIILGLLDFARASTITMLPGDLVPVLENCLTLLKHDFSRYGIKVTTEIQENLPEVVMDRNRIEQVFINLFGNAVRAMPEGGKLLIQVRWERPKDAEARILVRIQDSGVGIPEHVLNRIFEPFFTTRLDSGGTGLGLSIVKNIVEIHHGKIQIENAPEGGAVATVFFPVGKIPEAA